jgi:CheY-like chemotaxis protein
MRHILLVDDDPLVLQMYKDGLGRLGAQVTTAADGLAAIRTLRTLKPDAMVLDLMMPKFTGVDVLKFVRSEPTLKDLPVVILSNSYMDEVAAQATALGVQKALLKVRCNPSVLFSTVNDIVAGSPSSEDSSFLLAVPDRSPPPTKPAGHLVAPAQAEPPPVNLGPTAAAEFSAKAREGFLQNARATCASLRTLCQGFTGAPNPAEGAQRLQALYRKVHFIAATAGLAECHRLAQMASAFEALLFELTGNPTAASASVLRTIANTVDVLALLFDCARDVEPEALLIAQALVVDDDPACNRLVASALQRAQFQVSRTEDPQDGLQRLQQRHFDLVVLDIVMPGIGGFELCRRLRKLPGYQKTPVIFVTAHNDFENRAQSRLSGGDDLIAKPLFPMELTVKAVALLLKRRMAPAEFG